MPNHPEILLTRLKFQKAKWFDTKYLLAELPEKLMEKAKSMKFDKSRCPFKLPEKNIMIPKNF